MINYLEKNFLVILLFSSLFLNDVLWLLELKYSYNNSFVLKKSFLFLKELKLIRIVFLITLFSSALGSLIGIVSLKSTFIIADIMIIFQIIKYYFVIHYSFNSLQL